MSKPNQTDWVAAKAEYVANPSVTFAEIAVRHGTTPAAVGKRAQKDGWTDAREKLTKKIESKVISNAANRKVSAIQKMNEDHSRMARSLASTAALVLQKSVKRNEAGQVVGTDLEPRDINSLSAALVNAQKIERIAAGMSTENTSIHAHIDEADPLSILTPDAKAAIYKALDGSY